MPVVQHQRHRLLNLLFDVPHCIAAIQIIARRRRIDRGISHHRESDVWRRTTDPRKASPIPIDQPSRIPRPQRDHSAWRLSIDLAMREMFYLCSLRVNGAAEGVEGICTALQRLQQAFRMPFGRRRSACYLLQCLPRARELRSTPAMTLGIAERAWTIGDLLDAACQPSR